MNRAQAPSGSSGCPLGAQNNRHLYPKAKAIWFYGAVL